MDRDRRAVTANKLIIFFILLSFLLVCFFALMREKGLGKASHSCNYSSTIPYFGNYSNKMRGHVPDEDFDVPNDC
ncbi:hypothetical protein LBYZC6_41010 [Lacrimispora brassicae]